MGKKLITSALPYVNNQPHLGNIIGSILSGDCYNRYCKKNGEETIFISGTDEYGTATEMEAMKQGVHPNEIVSKNRELHKTVYSWFDCDFDHFGNTTCERHTKIVQNFFKNCYENGYFEEQEIEQFYCNSCEQFLADRFVLGECSFCGDSGAKGDQCDSCGKCLKTLELKNPKCAICNSIPILKISNHLFLRLDLLEEETKNVMKSRIDNWTDNARNIYKYWLDKKLASRCMTRSLKYKWGVPVPLEKYNDKVFYVWFDAVIGYITFLSQAKPEWETWTRDAKIIQFMGKDNVFFHSFIFPGILLASGHKDYIVDVINSTEFLNFNGLKFSKSRGVGIFGMDLVTKDLGISCYWRFYLLRRRPESKDSDFLIKEFEDLIDADLRKNLGNLCQRVLKFLKSKCNSIVNVESLDDEDDIFVADINSLYTEYKSKMEDICLRDALAKALEISSRTNLYIQRITDNKENREKLSRGFSIAYSSIVLCSKIFYPFIPKSCVKLSKMCLVDENSKFPESFEVIRSAKISSEIDILFPELTSVQKTNLNSYLQ